MPIWLKVALLVAPFAAAGAPAVTGARTWAFAVDVKSLDAELPQLLATLGI